MSRTPHWHERVAAFKTAPKSDTSPIVFAGDSLTELFDLEKFFNFRPIINHGISGDHIDGLTERLALSFSRSPRALFFMIGINDIFDDCDFPLLEQKYKTLLDGFSGLNRSGAPLFCFSLLPVGREWQTAGKTAIICKTNRYLQKICAARLVNFLNIYPYFEKEKDCLNAALSLDGIHLNKAGYSRWRQALTILQKNFTGADTNAVFELLL